MYYDRDRLPFWFKKDLKNFFYSLRKEVGGYGDSFKPKIIETDTNYDPFKEKYLEVHSLQDMEDLARSYGKHIFKINDSQIYFILLKRGICIVFEEKEQEKSK